MSIFYLFAIYVVIRYNFSKSVQATIRRNMLAAAWQHFIDRLNRLGPDEEAGRLGDFTTRPRVIYISLLAIMIGVLSAFVALVLLRLIGLFTNLFFFQRWGFDLVSP